MSEVLKQDVELIEQNLFRISDDAEINEVERMGGLTNHTYRVNVSGVDYVFRVPGDGTEELINRNDEKKSTELACKVGVDAQLLYFGDDGLKITKYITNARTMSPDSMKDEKNIKEAAEIFYTLHTCGMDTGVPFEVFEMAHDYETFILKNNVALYEDYAEIKSKVQEIKEHVDKEKVQLAPCHNDPLCENWVRDDERMYLIDWEYAGMNDPMWDVADISIEAGYDEEQDQRLLEYYMKSEVTERIYNRFMANKIYLDYLWTLWGLTRVPFDGQPMIDYANERYDRLKDNIAKLTTK